jgi:hypothetical membrane protein
VLHKRSAALLAGSLLWISSVQYFIVQIVVARSWSTPFSLSKNPISDLGNTACAPFGGRFVCSPDYRLMNLSFVILGITMIIGALLLIRAYKMQQVGAVGFVCMAVAGLGTVIIGLFPENSQVPWAHTLGASLPFLVGNIGMILVGCSVTWSRTMRLYSIASGIVCLVALVLYVTKMYAGLGNGGMERLVVYPQTIWLIVFGCYGWLQHNVSVSALTD